MLTARIKLTGGIVAILSVIAIPQQSFSCSPPPISYRMGIGGQPIPIPHKYAYEFSGEILGDETVLAKSPKGEKAITALRVRVIESKNAKTVTSDVHRIYKTSTSGPSCEQWPESLTVTDFPVGTKVQVNADALSNSRVYRLE